MNVARIATVLIVSVLTTPISLLAQRDTLVLEPGMRIRVRAPTIEPDKFVATVTGVHGDTLELYAEVGRGDVERSMLEVPLSAVTRLGVSQGKHPNLGKGALTGGLVGAAIGLAVGISATGEEAGIYELGASEVLQLTAGLGAIGAGVGMIFAVLLPGERWEEIPLDKIRIEPSPVATDGVSVSLSLRL